jgi:hypothetical protein
MPSALPPAGGSVERTWGLHRIPPGAVIPQEVVVTAAQAPNTNNVRSWWNTAWHFYLVGQETWAAQFSVDANGDFTLFVYTAVDPSVTYCVYTIKDQLSGVLFLGHDAHGAPYLSFPPRSGTETILDECGVGPPSGTRPLNFNWAWYIKPYNAAGGAWEFINSGYGYPWSNFIFRSGLLNGAAAQAAASTAADNINKLPGTFEVKQST